MTHENDPLASARNEFDETGVEPATGKAAGQQPGDIISNYKLLQEIGEGGMGSVWMAEQFAPMKRMVALKIIKLGMDTREVVTRFEAERQALALMDHPNITKVLDGGATENGRPFFVMELVVGKPITEYCEAAKLGLRDRLELFSKVCEAVQHAHQKGVIHRDIKPSNVMVTMHDGVPVPKVIDFGIAKATSAELTQKTMFTQYAQIIGTPEYMAPEQAELSGLDIDTRADVYSLGVLLYEMLTGLKPFDMRTVMGAGYSELLRTIREVDPPKPSTRVSTMNGAATTMVSDPFVNMLSLSKSLRGDLDWIVMKALEKDRTRRYDTATGLSDDIRRYLNEEAVVAAPPSASYRMRKLYRRKRKTVLGVGVFAVLLIAGSVGTGIGLWRAVQANRSLDVALNQKADALVEEQRQRELAEANEQRAIAAEAQASDESERAVLAEAEAERRAAESQKIVEFQTAQLAQLDSMRMGETIRSTIVELAPEGQRERLRAGFERVNFTDVAMQNLEDNLFDQTIRSIDAQFADQPQVRWRLWLATVEAMHSIGLNDAALSLAERCRDLQRELSGEASKEYFIALNWKGILLREKGVIGEAYELVQQSVDGLLRVAPDDSEPYGAMTSLIIMRDRRGDTAGAILLAEQCLAGMQRVLGNEHRHTVNANTLLAALQRKNENAGETEAQLRADLLRSRRGGGNDHPQTLDHIAALGYFLWSKGRMDEAEPLFREDLERRRRVNGNDSSKTLVAINNLGNLLAQQGDLVAADPLIDEALAGLERTQGKDNLNYAAAVATKAMILRTQGSPAEAEVRYREALAIVRKQFGNRSPYIFQSVAPLNYCLREQGKFAEAVIFLTEEAERMKAEGEPAPQGLSEVLVMLGDNQLVVGDAESAKASFREALAMREAKGGALWSKSDALTGLAAALFAQKRFAEAESCLGEHVIQMLSEADVPLPSNYGKDLRTQGIRQAIELYETWELVEPDDERAARLQMLRSRLAQYRAEHPAHESGD